MSLSRDRLYNLLPVIYRRRDEALGSPLKAALQVISEQVDLVEADISQLYENWFIETCEDWVVPYIAELIGYRPVQEAGEPGDISTLQGQQRNKILIPRREVGNTIRYRQSKGTLALLELLSNDVAGWPARVVEFYKFLGWTQHLNHLSPLQGQTVDLHEKDALDRLNTPFDKLAHTIDVRRIQSSYSQGQYNLPNIGVFIYRLKAYSVTRTPAYCLEEVGPHCYTFSVLGNDAPLYTRPQPEPEPTHIADELNLPIPISRRSFEAAPERYYGETKSLQIWVGTPQTSPLEVDLVPLESIIVADLSDWQYRSPQDKVAVDPVLGRIVFPVRQLPKAGVWVYYHYGFSADMGGGEYDRPLSHPTRYKLYRVGKQQALTTINAALSQWHTEKQAIAQQQEQRPEQSTTLPEDLHHAVVEIVDSGVYTEHLEIHLDNQCSLQIRAANRTRPVIRLLDYQADAVDSLRVYAKSGSQFCLDGLLVAGRGIQVLNEATDSPVESTEPQNPQSIPEVMPSQIKIRHSTLVPGWSLHSNCDPKRPNEPSLELFNFQGQVEISHSIVGSIQVNQDEVYTDPLPIHIRDSIVDATSSEQVALDAVGYPVAHAQLTIVRTTVLGQILTQSIALAENSIFDGKMLVARRQIGCMRFCYVTPDSRTPRRYNCQPDLVETAIAQTLESSALQHNQPKPIATELAAAQQREQERVHPRFNTTRYSTPTYCQLSNHCAEEIKRGADDESEMGAFHNLYQPQRAANLSARLNEYTPARMEIGIIFLT